MTNGDPKPGVPRSYWVIGTIALVWNVAGAVNFVLQMDPDMVAAYRESEQAIIANRPAWATVAFAVAVFGGTLGSLLLLLRRSAAIALLAASLLGVIVTMMHTLGLDIDFGAGEVAGIVVMPVLVAGCLVWYARLAARNRWLA